MNRLAFWAIVGFFVLTTTWAPAADRIYTLVPDTPFEGSPYGFSGTITTDGSIGTMSDVSFIKDWSITIRSPSDFDGVATEVFTRSSGPPLVLAFGSIDVSENGLALRGTAPSSFVLGEQFLDPTSVRWISGRTGGGCIFCGDFSPSVQIMDLGESPETAMRDFGLYRGVLSVFTFAVDGVAIPEPGTLALVAMGLLGLVVRVRRPSPLFEVDSKGNQESHAEMQRRGGVSFGPSSLRLQRVCVRFLLLLAFTGAAHPDIYQWEYINPGDPSQGQRQRRLRSLAKLKFGLLTSMAVLLLVPRFATPFNASVFNSF